MGRKRGKRGGKRLKKSKKANAGSQNTEPGSWNGNEVGPNSSAKSPALAALDDKDVLNEVFGYLKAPDLVTCRSVCALWNNESMRVLKNSRESFFDVNVYANIPLCNSIWTVEPRAESLQKFLTEMSQGDKTKSLFRNATFNFDQHDLVHRGNPRYDHRPFFREFGWMIQHLEIRVSKISDMFNLFKLCRHLKTLELRIHVSVKRAVTTKDYNVPANKVIIMEHLHSLDLTYNIQWGFGECLRERIPNLTTFKVTDLSRSERSVAGPPKDGCHFKKELMKMKSSKLKVIEFSDGHGEYNVPKQLLEVDLTSLTSFAISQSIICGFRVVELEWMDMLAKVAPTLECVNFALGRPCVYVFRREDEFPYLPRVTQACIPYNMVKTSNFFQKMPSLRKLQLTYRVKALCSHAQFTQNINDYCNKFGARFSIDGGFSNDNEQMWFAGREWRPHLKLRILDLEIGNHSLVPDTFCKMFPNLHVLNLDVTEEGLPQLSNLLGMIKNLGNLAEFSVRQVLEVSYFRYDELQVRLRTVFVLLGILSKYFEALIKEPVETWTEDQLCPYLTGPSLRDLSSLRKFTLKRAGYTVEQVGDTADGPKISKLLEVHCFSHMHLLEKILVANENSPRSW